MSLLTTESYEGDFDATDVPDGAPFPSLQPTQLPSLPPIPASAGSPTPYCMMQKGGAFVNAGTYGCAFAPPLKCTVGSKNPKPGVKAVGKVFSNQRDFLSELSEIQQIEVFDKGHLFTIPYLGNCSTNKSSFTPTDEVSKCSRHITASKKKYDQILFQYGGVDLANLYEKPNQNPIHLDDLFRIILPVFEGIQRMIKQEVAHSDIKPPNMLCDVNATPIPRIYLIDFGLLTPFPKLKTSFFMHAHRYPYYPPEFRIFNSRRIGIFDTQIIQQYCIDNFAFLNAAKFIHWISQRWPSYMLEMQRVVEDMNATSFRTIMLDFDKVYAPLVDVYGVAMTIVEVVYRLETTGHGRVRNLAFFDKFLTGVLFPMIHPNPYRRIRMEEAIKRTKALLKAYPFTVTTSNFVYTRSQVAKPALAAHPIVPSKTPTSAQKPEPISEEECKKLSGKEIKKLLKDRNQPTYGTKAVMCERLMRYLRNAYEEHQNADVVLQKTIAKDESAIAVIPLQPSPSSKSKPKRRHPKTPSVPSTALIPTPANTVQEQIDLVYKKSLRNCKKSDSNGGYPIKDLRAIAKNIGLKEKKKRKEICDELVQLRLAE